MRNIPSSSVRTRAGQPGRDVEKGQERAKCSNLLKYSQVNKHCYSKVGLQDFQVYLVLLVNPTQLCHAC